MEARLTEGLNIKPGDWVWDAGGFQGDWAWDILMKYGVHPEIFEPVPGYAEAIRDRGLTVHEYGLLDRDIALELTIAGDRSSAYEMGHQGTGKVMAQFKDVAKVIHDQPVKVLKLNVEGGEYPILDRLIGTGKIAQIGTLLVQFHTFIPDYGEKYLAIRNALRLTHNLAWRDPFVWERWDAK